MPNVGETGVGKGREKGRSFMAYVIAEPCINVKDTACVDACPVDCIHPRKDEADFAEAELLYIHPIECIDCGACVPVCPVSAIFALDDLPAQWEHYAKINADHYEE
jgi:ferredoxin